MPGPSRWQAGGTTVDPARDTVNFVGATATDVDGVTTLTFQTGDITSVVAGSGLSGGGTSAAVTLAAADLTGAHAANNAAANVIGSIPVIHRITVPAGTTGDVDVTLTHKTLVTDCWLYKTTAAGGGAGTIQVKNGASAISSAMSIDINDAVIARTTSIDDAANSIAAAGTLRITRTRTASTDESCVVFVQGLRVA